MTVPDIYVSTAYILITLGLAELTRFAYNHFLEPNSLALNCWLEFISACELCAVCYENGIIAEQYGVLVYAVYLFSVGIWWNYRWTVSVCPYILIEIWLDGQIDAITALCQMISQILGASVFYSFYLKHLWGLEFGDAHKARVHREEQCFTDIQVSVWLAALIEGASVFVSGWISRLVSQTQLNDHVKKSINALVGVCLVLAALDTTGGYFNPIIASSLQYGCRGATLWEHFTVYSISTVVGAVLVVLLW